MHRHGGRLLSVGQSRLICPRNSPPLPGHHWAHVFIPLLWRAPLGNEHRPPGQCVQDVSLLEPSRMGRTVGQGISSVVRVRADHCHVGHRSHIAPISQVPVHLEVPARCRSRMVVRVIASSNRGCAQYPGIGYPTTRPAPRRNVPLRVTLRQPLRLAQYCGTTGCEEAPGERGLPSFSTRSVSFSPGDGSRLAWEPGAASAHE
jgi:hypothetical protein